MAPGSVNLDGGLLEQLVLQLRGAARSEIDDLLKSFAQGEIAKEQVLKRLVVLYQTSFGGAVRSLAALDEDAAREWSAFLRRDTDRAMADIEETKSSPLAKSQKAPMSERLKNKSDGVLKREQILFKELTKTDQQFTLSELVDLLVRAKSLDPSMSDPAAAVTAHLDRLTKDGLIVRPRKGHYSSTPQSKAYLKALVGELEARAG